MKNKKSNHSDNEDNHSIYSEEIEAKEISVEDQIEVFSEILADLYIESISNKIKQYEKETGSTS